LCKRDSAFAERSCGCGASPEKPLRTFGLAEKTLSAPSIIELIVKQIPQPRRAYWKTQGRVWVLLGLSFCAALPAAANWTPPKNPMDNVYDIVKRHVAHRSIISQQREIALGTKYAKEIARDSKLVKDPVITEYVNRVEQNIAQNSDAKIPITVKVIDSPEINAFALPGGYIFVDTGLLRAAGSEAQLAGVLAHETAHITANHFGEEATRKTLLQYAMIPLIFTPMTYPVYLGLSTGMNLGIPLAFLKFSRSDEQQADFLGLQYMWKAGYDPEAYLSMFGKILQEERSQPGSVPKIFMDHPPTTDRIIKAEEEIKTILPPRQQYLDSTSEFAAVQERLNTLLGNMRRNKKDRNRPTLIRRAQNSKTGSGPTSDDDKPPVLRRRD
jgi:predicted Zn-dependent protease